MGFRVASLFGVPVSVTAGFFLMSGYFFYVMGAGRALPFVVAVLLSLLVHEFGHALVAKRLGLDPRVLLQAFGGLTFHERAARDRDDVMILAAGPGAGLAFGGVCLLALRTVVPTYELSGHSFVVALLGQLAMINLFWSLANLVPVWPLDGGQLFRLLLVRLLGPSRGESWTHRVGLGLGGALALMAYFSGQRFITVLLAMLAFQNFSRLQAGISTDGLSRRARAKGRQAIEDAERALGEGRFEEAARAAHRLRAETILDESVLARVWTVLSVATVGLGRYQEALSYIRRAPPGPVVAEAHAAAAVGLGLRDEAEAWRAQYDLSVLGPKLRPRLEALLAPASAGKA